MGQLPSRGSRDRKIAGPRVTAGGRDQRLADILLVAAWTALSWSELREVRVRDFVRVPMPVLLVSRAAPEGVDAKVTKSGKTRRVPVADRVLPIVLGCADGKGPEDLLFTTRSGHQLHATAVKRSVAWSQAAPGRRIHDLRHTAACLWLAKGVDPVTVQAGSGTPRSRRRTSTSTTWAVRPIGPDRTG